MAQSQPFLVVFEPFCEGYKQVIANGKTTLQTLNRQPKHKQKVNHFDR